MVLLSFINKSQFIPVIFFTITVALASVFYALKTHNKAISFKVFMIYSVITIIVYGCAGFVGFLEVDSSLKVFIISQFLFFVFGIVHYIFLNKFIAAGNNSTFFQEVIFTLYIAVLGILVYQIVYSFSPLANYSLLFTAAQIIFVLPFLIIKSAELAILIPEKIYTKWYFPAGDLDFDIPEEQLEDKNIILIEIQIQRSLDSPDIVPIRGRAPLKMEFGLYFALAITEYNDSNAGKQIRIEDDTDSVYGWNFYFKPKFFSSDELVDPLVSIRENGIRENNVIIAERV
ncbi:MAG: TssN family type VI secretion system protein [Bacteroidota bacterium]